ncbi:MAG: hypothetical protein RBU29_11860, partial [bacterium]|nr:hypothetical protein [bacterium]
MKNSLPLVLVFLVGLAIGLIANQLPFFGGEDAASLSLSSGEAQSKQPGAPENQSVSQRLYHDILPQTAPAWLLANGGELSKTKQAFAEVLKDETISTIANDFIAALPQGVTDIVSNIIRDASETRLFLFPPEGGNPASLLVGLVQLESTVQSATPTIDLPAHFIAAYPDTSTREIKVGSYTIQTIQSPLGELGIFCDEGYVWLTNQPPVFDKFWGTPPAPAANPGEKADYIKTLEDHKDTALALFINTPPNDPASILPPGLLPEFMAAEGMKNLTLLFQQMDGKAKITLKAKAENIPPWITAWTPLDTFPFAASDPMGMLEVAMRWPSPQSATDEISAASGIPGEAAIAAGTSEDPTPVTFSPGSPSPSEEGNPSGGERRGERMRNPSGRNMDPAQMQERLEQLRQEDPERAERMAQRMKAREEAIVQSHMRFLAEMVPAGSSVGMNMFGFYNGNPTIAFALPNGNPAQPFLDLIKNTPGIEQNEIDIAKLPAKEYRFPSQSPWAAQGLDQMLTVQRDGTTYIFDEIHAAQKYLQNLAQDTQDQTRRDSKLRAMIEEVQHPAQFQTILANDFFLFLLDQEKMNIPQTLEFRQELEKFLTQVGTQTKPMAISAGFSPDDHVWFLEAYAES